MPKPQITNHKPPSSPAWTSTWVALASMLLYATSNAILRYLGELGAPIDWTLSVKESVTVVMVLPWIIFRFFQGRYRFLSKRLIFAVFLGGFICEVLGAQSQLWSYTIIGLVISAPTIQSTQMIASAVLGRAFLKDAVSRKKLFAILLLVLAVFVLSIASLVPDPFFSQSAAPETTLDTLANETETSEIVEIQGKPYLLGALAAMLAGIAYAVHIIFIRYAMQKYWQPHYGKWQSVRVRHWIGYDHQKSNKKRQAPKTYTPFPITLVMLIVTGIGSLYYGGSVCLTRGVQGFVEVPPECWFWVVLCGLANGFGFFFQIQGLLLASAAKVSLISTAQIVILSVIGIVFFHESMSLMIILGAALTIAGVFLTSKEAD